MHYFRWFSGNLYDLILSLWQEKNIIQYNSTGIILVLGFEGSMDLDNDIRTDFSKHWLSYVLCFVGLATFSEYSSIMVASGLKPISLKCPKVNRKKG